MVKVLFLQNLENHKVGDISNVPDGFARNYLLPKNVAVLATDDEVNKQQSKIEKLKAEEEKITAKLTKTVEEIESKTFTIEAQAGDEGKLFGAITNRDVAEALGKAKYEFDRHMIEIPTPIHELGENEALLHLGHGINAKLKLDIKRAAAK